MNSFISFFLLILLAILLFMAVDDASAFSKFKFKPKQHKCMMYEPPVNCSHAGHRVKRLAGGSEGDIHKMPWIVYISAYWLSINNSTGTTNRFTNCTGSLISPRHVLTAGHCILPISSMPNSSYTYTVSYGASNHSQGRTIVLDGLSGHRHPNFSSYTNRDIGGIFVFFDIGILDLGQDLELDETVHSVCVACLNNQTEPTGPAIIAGWGNKNGACFVSAVWPQDYPDVFKYDTVGIHQCLTPDLEITDNVCTDADSSQGIGGGDSGGPVLTSFNNGTTFLQAGVNGHNTCRADMRENGFVKIDGKWLKEVTGIENICKLEGTDFTMKE